jgi:hypothetical protein
MEKLMGLKLSSCEVMSGGVGEVSAANMNIDLQGFNRFSRADGGGNDEGNEGNKNSWRTE